MENTNTIQYKKREIMEEFKKMMKRKRYTFCSYCDKGIDTLGGDSLRTFCYLKQDNFCSLYHMNMYEQEEETTNFILK
jgi:hypothetical protein